MNEQAIEKATPRPWRTTGVGEYSAGIYSESAPPQRKYSGDFQPDVLRPFLVLQAALYCDATRTEAEANAELIVRAVNSFEALREALKAATTFADKMGAMMRDYELPEDCNGIIAGELDALNEALALAEGKAVQS